MDNVDFFEAFAPYYERYYADVSAGTAVAQWNRRLEAAQLVPTEDVRRANSYSLVDVGCGPGWHLREWAAAAYCVTGIDASPAMLRIAAANMAASPSGRRPALYCADIREPETLATLTSRFALAVAHFNFFNLFSAAEIPLVFASVAAVLTTHGVFATDLIIGAVPAKPGELESTRRVKQWDLPAGRFDETYWVHSLPFLRRAALEVHLTPVDGANWGLDGLETPLSPSDSEPTKVWLAFRKEPTA